ncbi:MAG: fibronectin type III domain-containing protein, partial [Sphaerochaetaceae bacterium]|nr:fibronectin type III domain-containing protein [Sphaerochaetaceae bacterium]
VDTTGPEPAIVGIVALGSTTAMIQWTTDEAGNSLVTYGPTPSYGYLDGQYMEYTTQHIVHLSRLLPGTLYHYKTVSRDLSGNVGTSEDKTFVTLGSDGEPVETVETPIPPPNTLPGLEEGLTDDESSILDTISRASESFITAILSVLPNNPNLDKIPEEAFVQTIEEIAPKVVSAPEITSQDLSVEVGPDWARFRWVTNKKSNAVVALSEDAGFDGVYGRIEGDPETLAIEHTVLIEGLKPQTMYHYQLQSKGS